MDSSQILRKIENIFLNHHIKMIVLLGLSLMGPPWLAFSTSEGKTRGPGPWPFNHTICLFVPFKGDVPKNWTKDQTLKVYLNVNLGTIWDFCWDWALWAHHGWRLALSEGRLEAQDRDPSITPFVYLSLLKETSLGIERRTKPLRFT